MLACEKVCRLPAVMLGKDDPNNVNGFLINCLTRLGQKRSNPPQDVAEDGYSGSMTMYLRA